MKKNSKQMFINIFFIFYIISIFLDLHVFYNSIVTLIRALIITVLFLIVFFKYSEKKDRKYLYLYFGVFLIYLILHLLNISDDTILQELLYFYKMSMNVLIIYIVSKLGIKLDNFYKIINICLIIICGQIVFCNIFKLGYNAYFFVKPEYNIFEWGNYKTLFIHYTSKGFFHYTNQIVGILLIYIPILINYLKEKTNILNTVTLIITLLAMLILGNRSSSFGPLILMIVAILLYFFLVIIKKEKINIRFSIIMLISLGCYIALLVNSPVVERNAYYDKIELQKLENSNNIETIEEEKLIPPDKIHDELYKKLFFSRIYSPFYSKYYPYEQDRKFWEGMLKYDDNLLVDFRFLENKMIKRVVQVNDNQPYDALLGIGYDRIQNIQNIEQDYIMQYYSVGILGLIVLVGVYVFTYIYLIIKILFNLEKKFNYRNLMLLLSLGFVFCIAYFTGNLFNALSFIIPCSFMLGVAFNEITIKEKNGKILGFNVSNKDIKQIINKIDKDIHDKKQNVIYNINPLIVINFYKNKKIVSKFNEQKFNIPDGIGTVMAAKMKDIEVNQRITGVDLAYELCNLANKKKYKVYLYGAKEGLANKAAANLKKKYKNIKIVGTYNGYEKEDVVLKDINDKKPDILLVATGSPKQEEFIIKNEDKLKNVYLIMPVGGTFDIMSGNVKRSPDIWQKLRLEWFYRMIKEPKRIKANLNLIKFVFLVIFNNK